MTAWPDSWPAIPILDSRDDRYGVGWEFHDDGGSVVWRVLREDSGLFPVFSAQRGPGSLPEPSYLMAMTAHAVANLYASAALPDPWGWCAWNTAKGLMLAAIDIVSWSGDEWAVATRFTSQAEQDSGMPEEVATEWAGSDADRIPFNRLDLRGSDFDLRIGSYEDDDGFALSFDLHTGRPHEDCISGIMRTRDDRQMLTGPVRAVEVTYDNQLGRNNGRGFHSEVLLHGDAGSVLLVAAEIYEPGDWRIHDEMIVVIPSLSVANSLEWTGTPRPRWRSTIRP